MIATSFCPHRISIITGHYGTGKTEFAVNLAMAMAAEGQPVMMADLDSAHSARQWARIWV